MWSISNFWHIVPVQKWFQTLKQVIHCILNGKIGSRPDFLLIDTSPIVLKTFLRNNLENQEEIETLKQNKKLLEQCLVNSKKESRFLKRKNKET